ncbi:MAG: DUF58 domain-containing protein [Treponema sp.]|jgi:uncharacterized protein (DUF58 family)|nr:DUF58 domain-containing protein [Treponema sp.]
MNNSVRVSQPDVNIRGEKYFFACLPVFLCVFIFTPWRPVQFVCLFFIFLILGSRLYSEYLCRRLRVTRRDAEIRGFRYEWIDVEVVVENHGRLPAFMLAVNDTPGMLSVFRDNKSLGTLGGQRSRVLKWQAYGAYRGMFTLGPARIRCADPLGLFPFAIKAKETCRLFVYPALGYVRLKPPGGIPLGVLLSGNPFHEDLTRRRSIREYSGGDELRRINWKVSARMTTDDSFMLMVNEYEASLSYPLVVFLNADPAEYPSKNREFHLERVIEAAAGLCTMASRERQPLGFILHTSPFEAGETIAPAAIAHIPVLERLAVLERRQIGKDEEIGKSRGSVEALLAKAKSLPFGTRLVYVGPALESENIRLLEGMKKSQITLEYLMIDELNLPYAKHRYQIKEGGYEIL